MADVNGSVLLGVAEKFASASANNDFDGDVTALATLVGSNPPIYKNVGYYAAGSVWETWPSLATPNNTPPSGHALTEYGYFQIG